MLQSLLQLRQFHEEEEAEDEVEETANQTQHRIALTEVEAEAEVEVDEGVDEEDRAHRQLTTTIAKHHSRGRPGAASVLV